MGGHRGTHLPEQSDCGSDVTPGLALLRQQRGGNKEAPLVTMVTSLVSGGKFSGDRSEGGQEGQMDSIVEIYPSHAKENMEDSQKLLEI